VGTEDEINPIVKAISKLGYQIGGIRYQERKSLLKIYAAGDSNSVKPEYFYTLTMLPIGDYYVSSVSFDFNNDQRFLQSLYNQKDSPYHFVVKSGQITYLGDLYFLSPVLVDSGFFSASTYNAKILLLNELDKAKSYIKKFHPQLNFPVVDSLIQISK
jgi:hypothetical protein